MSTTIWLTIAGCAVVTAAIKAVGPVAIGGRQLPARLTGVIALMAPALLTALVVTSTFSDGGQLHLDAREAGVAAGGLVLVLRGPLVLAVVVAVGVTAGLRAVG